MKIISDLIRVKQWVKNLYVFLPAFFGAVFLEADIFNLIIGFFSFSFMASTIYIINDIQDIEADKKHPQKQSRPIAAGKIPIGSAVVIAIILFVVSVILAAFILSPKSWEILGAYFALNILYSFYLKKVAIIDLVVVATGFVLRLILGAVIANIQISYWLLLMTFLFALFIILAKRRDDFVATKGKANLMRAVNRQYNLDFLNTSIVIIATLMMVGYIMYTFNSPYFRGREYFALCSSVLVIVGVLRYFRAIFVENNGGSPTEFAFKDIFIQITVLLWILIFIYLIYF